MDDPPRANQSLGKLNLKGDFMVAVEDSVSLNDFASIHGYAFLIKPFRIAMFDLMTAFSGIHYVRFLAPIESDLD